VSHAVCGRLYLGGGGGTQVSLANIRKILRVAGVLLAVFAALGLTARYTNLIDRYFIFFPEKELAQDPGDRGIDFEDVRFTTSDGVSLHGWYVPGNTGTTLLWLHGNGGNIGHRVDNIAELHARLGVALFIFDYRGYGRSEGRPSEQGTYLDAEAALAYLASRRDVDPKALVLFGRSLGCAVAAEIATRHEFRAVILESPFTSIPALAKRHYPFLPGIGFFVRTRYDTLSKAKDVRTPMMVLHGDRDEVAPIEMGREVFDAAKPPKRFYKIAGAGHNDTYTIGGPAYYDALAAFLEDPPGGG
jgi:fermentation-respiration switch protein FrsA (DUF1100 family)